MSNIHCPVAYDLNAHLAAEEASDERGELVDARCDALMAPGCEYSPTTADAICEALGDPRPEFWKKLANSLQGDIRSALGCELIRKESDNYWSKLALPIAEKQIDDELKAAAIEAAEDCADMRKWDRDVEIFGYEGMA